MSFASTIANRAALATRVVSQVTKSSNNKRRSLIVKAEGDVPAETEKPAAAAPAGCYHKTTSTATASRPSEAFEVEPLVVASSDT